MESISDKQIIEQAAKALNSQKLSEGDYVADVGAAIVAENGEMFSGACIGGALGICAEQSAASQMLSRTGPKIKTIVAVWKDENGELYVIPPCGRCREFLRMLSQDNLDANVILGKDHKVKLKELLPFYGWHAEKV